MNLSFFRLLCVTFPLLANALLAQSTAIRGVAPVSVSVSAANYAETDRDTLLQSVEGRAQLNPEPPPAPAGEPVRFIFLPGEVYSASPTYEQLCRDLTPALAARGYLNATDENNMIRDPKAVTLVLRVSYGTRAWRNPTVRLDRLTWRDGLEPREKGRSLRTLGGESVWENRAGGADGALAAAVDNQSNNGSVWSSPGGGGGGGAGGGSTPATAASTGATAASNTLSLYESTRDFHMIVIDAFSLADLNADERSAKRLWTTFVAAPDQGDETFASMAATLIRNAQPYFGTTARGLQVIDDARAEVTLGDAVVVPE